MLLNDLMVQGPFNTREWLARWVWSVLEAGLVFCVWRGFPFLASGQIRCDHNPYLSLRV